MRVENADLRDDKRSLEDQLRYANQQVQVLKTQWNDQKAARDKQDDDARAKIRQVMGEIQSQNKELKLANQQLENQLKAATKQVQTLTAKGAELVDGKEAERRRTAGGDNLGFLRAENRQLGNASEKLQALEAKCSSLTNMNEGLRTDKLNLEHQVREAELRRKSDVQEASQKGHALENKCSNLEEKIHNLLTQCSTLNGKMEQLHAEKSNITDKLRDANFEIKALNVKVEEMGRTERELKDRLKGAKEEAVDLDKWKHKMEKAKTETARLESENAALDEQNTLLKRQLKEQKKSS